jgi:hypothetical protein
MPKLKRYLRKGEAQPVERVQDEQDRQSFLKCENFSLSSYWNFDIFLP